jgi:16S rRNA (adenine1518-N6/adenine1519-N6)-dimethyltransferase
MYKELWCGCLIEIGPGKGSLTKLIHDISPDFFVIEKDDKLISQGKLAVQWLEQVDVIHADVLDVDIQQELSNRSQTAETTLVVGNLPYYISSPILRTFFGEGQQVYAGGIFMVQKEVADKLRFDAHKKSYLWWILNYAYKVDYLKTVPAKAFSPAPKVQSALIKISTSDSPAQIPFLLLLSFLEDFAPYSRKTLWAIARMIQKKQQKDRNIPIEIKGKRLEELSWWDIEHILS